jgi:2'-5' RNA ligase
LCTNIKANVVIVVKNREQGKSEQPDKEKLRLFFALWPDSPISGALHGLARHYQTQCGGRVMRAESLHLTLLFLGDISAGRLLQLKSAVAAVHGSAFSLTLEQFAGWRHNAIGYAAPTSTADALSALVLRLRSCVAEAGFHFDQRSFTPHVTLLRKMAHTPQAQPIAPMLWPVYEFVLVQSVTEMEQVHYRILGRWPLA